MRRSRTWQATAQDGVERGTAALTNTLNRSRIVLLIVAIVSIIAAVGVGVLYVQRRLVERLISISNAMRQLAAGDVDSALPSISTRDEMGEMSRALQVLHAGEMERRKLIERERAEQLTQRVRASSVDKIIDDFRAAVSSVVTTLVDQRFGDGDDGARTFGDRQRGRRSGPRSLAFVRDNLEQRAHGG